MIILGIDTSQAASVALVDTDSGEVLAASVADSSDRRRWAVTEFTRVLRGRPEPKRKAGRERQSKTRPRRR